MSSADWVTIALLGKPRGNRGELTAVSLSSHSDRFEALERVHLFRGDEMAGEDAFLVEEIWEHKGALVFKFATIDSISDAERFQGCEVRVPKSERVSLDPGEYFHSDLIGCEVIDLATGNSVGAVTSMEEGSGGGLLAVGSGILIPFNRGLCTRIDVTARRIEVELPEGLLDLNTSRAV